MNKTEDEIDDRDEDLTDEERGDGLVDDVLSEEELEKEWQEEEERKVRLKEGVYIQTGERPREGDKGRKRDGGRDRGRETEGESR